MANGRTPPWLQEPLEQSEDMHLRKAAQLGDLDTLRTLLQEDSFKQRINKKLIWSHTPLRIAAMMGHSKCVEFLISQGAKVDLVDVKGQTAMYIAVVNGHLDCVKILLKGGADPNGSRLHETTPIYHAAQVGRVNILRELIRFNADVDVDYRVEERVYFGTRTLATLSVCPLFISAACHHFLCFRILLNAGANPNYNYNGPVSREALVRGSGRGREALVRGRASCILDAVLKLGCEPAFVRLLLDHGADPYLVPWDELDPDTMFCFKINAEALRIYQEAKRNPKSLMHLCRITIRKIMGKERLSCISSLELPEIIKRFMFHED
ncbi:ankyrin repeat and SOCS box protein 1-like isoform X1 [Megalobrama amblycephala]|uniref:ankyrin repeat and SOCS box protein 1-like isoform X1 n=2 Tax=Megalobrama amblycephala TaxID=75352 RepID=UPI0020143E4E|nr:ankyrin repeat and SOCS box protein 1-like isoform X1 [Megalobrama amblycephala]